MRLVHKHSMWSDELIAPAPAHPFGHPNRHHTMVQSEQLSKSLAEFSVLKVLSQGH